MALLSVLIVSTFVTSSYAYFDTLQDNANENVTIGNWPFSSCTDISTAQEFYDFVTSSTSLSTDLYCLVNDIDFTGFTFSYSSLYDTNQFLGTFDGAGYTLSNITMTSTDINSQNMSLFSTMNGATIQNVTIDNYTMGFTTAFFTSTSLQSAVLVSEVSGTGNIIDNVTINNSEVIGNSLTGGGGLVGNVTAGTDLTISNIKVRNLTVLNTSKLAGGIVGNVEAGAGTLTLEDIDFVGEVSSGNLTSNTGGLIGNIEATTVVINRTVVEYISSGTVTLSDGSISYTSGKYTGGFIGRIDRRSTISVSDSFFTGELYNDYKYVGSLSGTDDTAITQSNVYYSLVWFVNTYSTPSDKNVIHGTVVSETALPSSTWWNSFKVNFDNANSLWTQDGTGRLELIRP